MPVMETISIINKSGKVVSTTKHLVNIFKDAKEAYQEKKAELKAENQLRIKDSTARKMLRAREEVRSEASSRRRHSHEHRHRSGSRNGGDSSHHTDLPRRPALTERNLSGLSETSSRHGSRHGGSRHGSHRGPTSPRSPVAYQRPYFENGDIPSRPELARRHTDHPSPPSYASREQQMTRGPVPIFAPPQRSLSSPNFNEEVDMHLAYGEIPPPLPPHPLEKERELSGLMSKLNALMTEAQCVQHSATSIIAGLQANPEAMAAVALTLAEISNLLTKMSPGILTALKGSSPAIFALLASPQFLIAGGVAVGVTIVMFGGFKIIKKIQRDAAERKEAARMDEALVFDPMADMGSIESWRRGIADVESQSVATSVDGEFITPEAARQRKEKIRDRAREERPRTMERPKTAGSVSTVRRKDVPARSSSRVAESVSARTESTVRPSKKDGKEKKDVKVKKPSALSVLFKKSRDSKKGDSKDGSTSGGHRQPKLLEM